MNIVEQLINEWKDVIESINIDGYSRKVESIDYFRMNKYYVGYPEIEYCYKVNFNFPMNESCDINQKWHKELEKTFLNMFTGPVDSLNPRKGISSGETSFHNHKVEYMKNQGYRFIVQFYPGGFITERRIKSLNDLI